MVKGKRIYRLVKVLLFGPKSHELLIFCFFLAVSFGFWLLQALNETLEREVQVELQLENVPRDVVIIDSLPSTLSVVLRDRGLELARHSFSSLFRQNQVEIDFTKYDTGKKDAEVYISAADMQRMLSQNFAVSTKIQSFRPDTLRFSYNHGRSRTLPVKLEGDIKVAQGNYIKSISIEPDSVRIYAPLSVLDTMHAVYLDVSQLEEEKKGGRYQYQIGLRKQKQLKYEPEQVSLKVDIDYYVEKGVQVPVIGLNFPADKKLRTFPAEVTVRFNIKSDRSKEISPEDFVIATTYEDLLQNKESSKLQLHLKTVPEGITIVRIEPQEVDFLIEKVDVPQ